MDELRQGLVDIFEVEPEELTAETRLEDLNWDSLAIVSVIALFDDVARREVSVDELKACETIGDIEALARS